MGWGVAIKSVICSGGHWPACARRAVAARPAVPLFPQRRCTPGAANEAAACTLPAQEPLAACASSAGPRERTGMSGSESRGGAGRGAGRGATGGRSFPTIQQRVRRLPHTLS